MRKIYHIVELNDGRCNACGKAPTDAYSILDSMGSEPMAFTMREVAGSSVIMRAVRRLVKETTSAFFWVHALMRISYNATLVVQYPNRLLKKQSCLFITLLRLIKRVRPVILIHDIPNHEHMTSVSDIVAPKDFLNEMLVYDKIIAHNEVMIDWFVHEGIRRSKLVNLEIFDYLINGTFIPSSALNIGKVIIAGNLSLNKAGYLKALKDIKGVDWEIFGGPFNQEQCMGGSVRYCGMRTPDELPRCLAGGFGLVWDGPLADSCVGGWGAYLMINNPHKMSLYLASGIPVVTWAKAAQSNFVLKNGVGFVVDNIAQIASKIKNLTEDQYIEMQRNAQAIGLKLRSGYYLRRAIESCDEDLSEEE